MENYFGHEDLPKLKPGYVCWLDMMGTQSLMERSVASCSINICSLHSCISRIKKDISNDLLLYPVMDGAFISTNNKKKLEDFLKQIFMSIAKDFISQGEKSNLYQFVIRASIAYGPVGHGENIKNDKIDNNYKKSLLFGLPMTQAYISEKKALPFGIYIDKSARAFAPDMDHILRRVGLFGLGNRMK